MNTSIVSLDSIFSIFANEKFAKFDVREQFYLAMMLSLHDVHTIHKLKLANMYIRESMRLTLGH